jgi:hypothetical protein
MDEKEKSFEIGQRVRIIGPTTDGHAVYIGKRFFIDRIISPPHQQQTEYSRKDCGCRFPASSLEPIERDMDRLDAIEQRLSSIEELIQLPEGKVDTPDDMSELRVGDYVVTVGQPLIRAGHPVGTIDCVLHILYPLGWIVLKSSGLCYPRHHLRKLAHEEIPLRREDEE